MSKADHVTPKPSVQFWLENYPAKHLAGTETNHDNVFIKLLHYSLSVICHHRSVGGTRSVVSKLGWLSELAY